MALNDHHHGHSHDAHGHGQGHAHHQGHRHAHGNHSHGNHSHGHHGHSHAPASFGRAFAIGAILNLAFVFVEAAYGIISDSVALLADAGHNLSDVLSLIVAWVAMSLSQRQPTARFTYGLRSSSILAALFNALFLLVVIGGIAWEALRRLAEPPAVAGATMMVVAAIGVFINAGTAMLFMRGRKGDLNIRGAYLHMIADAAISAGVVLSGAVIYFTGWNLVDPVVSLIVSALIVYGTWGLLRDSVRMTFGAVPDAIDPTEVRQYLAGQAGVAAVHDLHIWSLSTTETALTAHLVMPSGHPGDQLIDRMADELNHKFGIGHTTLQVELDGDKCRLAPDHIV
ncbi:cation diffusion facilitator family transporter [Dongia soli]|uniref:Cation diffusion facilitator family transporter n=1 Tax=Dongia soli TaxID=600628 RepID=A0ABU5E9R8_9PROT|nr:cation diffusion facilitator family transporter [Dongia soli]MDY0883105.1 cation diffusion facilitator family transporter [Dongia soli]